MWKIFSPNLPCTGAEQFTGSEGGADTHARYLLNGNGKGFQQLLISLRKIGKMGENSSHHSIRLASTAQSMYQTIHGALCSILCASRSSTSFGIPEKAFDPTYALHRLTPGHALLWT